MEMRLNTNVYKYVERDEDGNIIKSYNGKGSFTAGNPLYNSTLNTYDIAKYTEFVNNFFQDFPYPFITIKTITRI